MSDYINREDALNQFYTLYYFPKGSGDQYMDQIESIHDRIRDLPSADVVERKRGEWLDVTTLDNEFICWVCSECRHGTDFVYEPYNYCPNCGADMRGDSDV